MGRYAVRTHIESGDLVLEHEGTRYQPPFRRELILRTGERPGTRAVAAILDSRGKELTRFTSTLEDQIAEQEEAAVLARADALLAELDRALEEGALALGASRRELPRRESRPERTLPAPEPVPASWADKMHVLLGILVAVFFGFGMLMAALTERDLPTETRLTNATVVREVPGTASPEDGSFAVLKDAILRRVSQDEVEKRAADIAAACGLTVTDAQPV